VDRFAFPTWWHYDVLRGLEYLRSAGVTPDERVAEAIELVESKRDSDGRWLLETRYPGVMPVDWDEGEGQPSRWNTLRALRVLDWYSNRLFDHAREMGYHTMRLETNPHSQQRAFAFYKKLGFAEIPRYGDDVDDVGMEKFLLAPPQKNQPDPQS
jgi:GNAT superfamily N-acetyltransferase